MATGIFRHESLQDQDSIVEYLHALADGFKNGALHFSDGSNETRLEPHGLMQFQINTSQKRKRMRLTLRFTWTPKDNSEPASGSLTISSQDEEED